MTEKNIYININIFEIYFLFILFIYLFIYLFLLLFSGTQLRICVQVATPLLRSTRKNIPLGNHWREIWIGFNICAHNKVQVSQDVITYLPTIEAQATDMATVHEVLLQ